MVRFLEDDVTPPAPEDALFHIIPVPLEQSVSYGGGAAKGPRSILSASQQLEVYDGVSTPALDDGIYTYEAVYCDQPVQAVLDTVGARIQSVLDLGKIPVLLGGEHTVTVGALTALKERFDEVGIIQFDAHADLRDEYEGSELSHACVMKRVLDADIPMYQVGVRAISEAEQELRDWFDISYLDAVDIYRTNQKKLTLPKGFPKKVYVTIDVDGLDPSVIPDTGTPVPGGILWYDMLAFLEQITEECEVIGFDIMELSAGKSERRSSFAAAQLIYSFMGMISRRR